MIQNCMSEGHGVIDIRNRIGSVFTRVYTSFFVFVSIGIVVASIIEGLPLLSLQVVLICLS